MAFLDHNHHTWLESFMIIKEEPTFFFKTGKMILENEKSTQSQHVAFLNSINWDHVNGIIPFLVSLCVLACVRIYH